jgi:hypothetical protein
VSGGGQDLYCPRCGAGVARTATGILYTLPDSPQQSIEAPLSAIDAPTAQAEFLPNEMPSG